MDVFPASRARRRLLLVLIASWLAGGTALGASGVHGRVAWRGDLAAGITVRAYHSLDEIAEDKAVVISTPTQADGTYRLELLPGSYYLTARDGSGPLRPGNLYGYFSGGPVQVVAGAFRNVGFNLIRVPHEASPETAQRSELRGEINYQGTPLERAYLYVYKDTEKGFKGPAYVTQPVEKGKFRLGLPPGKYWLLVRKRLRGGPYGPVEKGDYFGYYYGNPVTLKAGQVRDVRVEAITRLAMLEDDPGTPFNGVRGTLVDASGKPVSRLHVFAYRHPEMTGTPDFFSQPSGSDGRFELGLPDSGPFYLLARQGFGGPAGEQELYGRLGSPVKVDLHGKTPEVTIHVAPKN